MITIRPRLYLITPPLADVEAFRPALVAACAAASVAAVLLRLEAADERTLVNRAKSIGPAAQDHDAALVVADPGRVDLAALATRSGADGAHASDPDILRDLGQRLGEGRVIGAGELRTKHDAMTAGEIGVDYVMFGEPRPDGFIPPLELVEERARWWAEIFQTPCVVFAPNLADVTALAGTGADFVALGNAVWDHADGPAAAMRTAAAALKAAVPEEAS